MSYEEDLERQNEQLQEKLEEALATISSMLDVDAAKSSELEFLRKKIGSLEDVQEQYVDLVAKYKKLKRTLEIIEKDHKANKIYKVSKRARSQIEEEERNALWDKWDDDDDDE
jgi:hypothetical protein